MRSRRAAVSPFFEALQNRNFSTAEAVLSEFREKAQEEWSRGYACAMEGLLLSARSNNDRYLYYKKLPSTLERVQESRRRVRRRVAEMDVQAASFDKGFFACWLDFLGAAERRLASAPTAPTVKARPQLLDA